MIIGITGGIGSGKSYVASLLKNKGFECFDSDTEAKTLMISDPIVIQQICSCVGVNAYNRPDVNNPDLAFSLKFDNTSNSFDGWTLNKSVVSEFLFKNEENKKAINDIVHPAVARFFFEWAKQRQGRDVFLESAILFESGFNRIVDFIVFVTANENIRIKRTMLRDQLSYESVLKKIKHQANQEVISKKADYIIYNNGIENILEQIDDLIKLLNLKP